MRFVPLGLLLVCASASMTACSDSTPPDPGPGGDSDVVSLKIMTFNIQLGGTVREPIERTIEVLKELDPDVIGFQELGGSQEVIAEALGYHLELFPGVGGVQGSVGIMTRFEVMSTFEFGARLEVPGAASIFVFDTHLPPFPYQPYDLRDGKLESEADAVVAATAARGEAISAVLADMTPLLDAGSTVFLTGDFNEPSSLDWTDETAAAAQHFGMKVAWPTSVRVANAGLKDAYRLVHPDPLVSPGTTWTPFASDDEVHDRIDFVYVGGSGVTVKTARVVGESAEFADVVLAPWPSDHRAVLIEAEVSAVGILPAE